MNFVDWTHASVVLVCDRTSTISSSRLVLVFSSRLFLNFSFSFFFKAILKF